jgi:hypothetical protein
MRICPVLNVTGTRGVAPITPPWKPPSGNWMDTSQSSMRRARSSSAASPRRTPASMSEGTMYPDVSGYDVSQPVSRL